MPSFSLPGGASAMSLGGTSSSTIIQRSHVTGLTKLKTDRELDFAIRDISDLISSV